MDGNKDNQGEGSQGFNYGGNSASYQGATTGWNPYMHGFQGAAAWFPQGFQQFGSNSTMMRPQSFMQQMQSSQNVSPFPLSEPIVHPEVNEQLDVEVLPSAPTASNRSGQKKAKAKTKTKLGNFSSTEDVCLVKAWLEISCDPIVGTGQRQAAMWKRIIERYDLRRGEWPRRTHRSLQSRWKSIKTDVGKFASYYANVVREHASGLSDADKATRAAAEFAREEKRIFIFMHCWEIMKDEPKWQDPGQLDASTEPVSDGLGDEDEQQTSGPDTPAEKHAAKRPIGRDRAKADMKKCKSSSGSSSSLDYAARMQDLSIQKLNMLQEETVKKGERFQQLASIDEKKYEEMRCHNKSLIEIEQRKLMFMEQKYNDEREREFDKEAERILAIDVGACPPALR